MALKTSRLAASRTATTYSHPYAAEKGISIQKGMCVTHDESTDCLRNSVRSNSQKTKHCEPKSRDKKNGQGIKL